MSRYDYDPPPVRVSLARALLDGRMLVMQGECIDVAVAQVFSRCGQFDLFKFVDRCVSDAYDVTSSYNFAMYRGYCYLWLIKPEWRVRAALQLGPSPTVKALMSCDGTDIWAFSRWSDLRLSRGGTSDFHISLIDEDINGSVDFVDSLLYMQLSASEVLPASWRAVVMPDGFSCRMSVYSTIGAAPIVKIDLASKLSAGYKAIFPSVGSALRRVITEEEFAVVASLYSGSSYPSVSVISPVPGTQGRAAVQLPAKNTDGVYLLPPQFYYIGDGFRIGSADVMTVMLVPAGMDMRISSEESRFRAHLPNPESFSPAFYDCATSAPLRRWWDVMHAAGNSSDSHFVRTQANVLIHRANTIAAAASTYVRVTDPLDEFKAIEIHRYEGDVAPQQVVHVGCEASTSSYTILSDFRSLGNVQLTMGSTLSLQETEARIAFSADVVPTITIAEVPDDVDLPVSYTQRTKSAFSFRLEAVSDAYSYDCEYDSGMSPAYVSPIDMSDAGDPEFSDHARRLPTYSELAFRYEPG